MKSGDRFNANSKYRFDTQFTKMNENAMNGRESKSKAIHIILCITNTLHKCYAYKTHSDEDEISMDMSVCSVYNVLVLTAKSNAPI